MTTQLQKVGYKPSEVQEREDRKQAEFEERINSVEFGGVRSTARYDSDEFKDGLKFLLSRCLDENGYTIITPEIKLALGNSSRLPVQLTNRLVVEDAFRRLKPHLKMILLENYCYHKKQKQIARDLHYERHTIQKHLKKALDQMQYMICND